MAVDAAELLGRLEQAAAHQHSTIAASPGRVQDIERRSAAAVDAYRDRELQRLDSLAGRTGVAISVST